MNPLCERALTEIERRLGGILVAQGYSTDAGLNVLRARQHLAPDEVPAVVVFDGGESVDGGTGSGAHASMSVRLAVDVEAHVAAEQSMTGTQLQLAKADIKRALCVSRGQLADSDGVIGALGYIGAQAQSRIDGAESESVTLQFEAIYKEAYGDPTQSR